MIPLGYACAIMSALLFPPGFGLAGVIIGALNIKDKHPGHGVAQIVMSVTFASFGAIVGAIMGARMLR